MSADPAEYEDAGSPPCRPPFPIFPIVCPLMFPIGFMIVMGRMRKRRRRALEARLAAVEEKLNDLAERMPPASD